MFLLVLTISMAGLVVVGILPARPVRHIPLMPGMARVQEVRHQRTAIPDQTHGPAPIRSHAESTPAASRPHHPNSKQNRAYKAGLPPLTSLQAEILYGMVLGDAHLHYSGRDVCLEIEQSLAQRVFVNHLFTTFQPYIFMKTPTVQTRTLPTAQQPYTSYRFQTMTHPVFTRVHAAFYQPSGLTPAGRSRYVKRIPADIDTWLTPRVLAYHIMCDGSRALSAHRSPGGVNLATHGFPTADTQRYADALRRFGLHPSLQKRNIPGGRTYTFIYFPKRDMPTLRKLLAPHMLPMFAYKLREG